MKYTEKSIWFLTSSNFKLFTMGEITQQLSCKSRRVCTYIRSGFKIQMFSPLHLINRDGSVSSTLHISIFLKAKPSSHHWLLFHIPKLKLRGLVRGEEKRTLASLLAAAKSFLWSNPLIIAVGMCDKWEKIWRGGLGCVPTFLMNFEKS